MTAFRNQCVDLRLLVQAVAAHGARAAAKKNMTVVAIAPDALPRLRAHGEFLLLALRALADDAIRRAPRDTVVEVIVRRARDATVFEVRDADTWPAARPPAAAAPDSPAQAQVREGAKRIGLRFRVATDRFSGTRAVIAIARL